MTTALTALALELERRDHGTLDRRAARALRDCAEAMEWRPIAEAPRGDRVLVALPAGKNAVTSWPSTVRLARVGADGIPHEGLSLFSHATHFRPLPEPPDA